MRYANMRWLSIPDAQHARSTYDINITPCAAQRQRYARALPSSVLARVMMPYVTAIFSPTIFRFILIEAYVVGEI